MSNTVIGYSTFDNGNVTNVYFSVLANDLSESVNSLSSARCSRAHLACERYEPAVTRNERAYPPAADAGGSQSA